ncbi:16S rRNA (cytosine(967)-C(5))-methyltransferase RsmB [Halalkalibacter akibai]|uniref:16S rRNA (cytosine(967)-C(5))-methyltransferase n=1 Tax=Halalkalibacter akibai (strain ATCC 43226 / DSM 21942 / CIP 109018 / JCM 9157 / 1139) TaxID=1236973 RepID=W4QP54_HALA3|nr:16S rRNA (cytosine(967)-C(5))-methyltransferase RsmB [Halalkalibacter akibai]GAE33900.1 ribosomal RNA small subunit methyltransferase B [Halalkalibacter akibai JCM 9157]
MSKPVREVALEILLQIEKNQAYSNLLLNQTVNRTKLDPRDVGLLTELVYGTIQRRDTLDFYLQSFVKKGVNSLQDWVKVLLRLSVYQLAYLDRIPDRAVVHEAVTIAKKRGHKGISGMVNGVLRSILREGLPTFDKIEDDLERLALETSFPIWLVKRWSDQFGYEQTKAMCESSLVPPSVTVRVNKIKATVEDAISLLEEEGLEVRKGVLSEDAIIIEKGNVFKTNAYRDGYITAQDESSMLVARAVGTEPNMTVIDACAAPGGKSTHMAELMEGQGKVLSFDLHEHKVKLIREQASRLGLDNITATALDARTLTSQYDKNQFDRVLVDAPCSGFGVIRRKPDIKWSKELKDIQAIQRIQLDILTEAAQLVKNGGKLIYSTCTVDKEENELVIEKFLNEHPHFTLDETLSERLPLKARQSTTFENGMITILPQDFETDGFFIASLVKQ